jgi:hypothetical protein
MIDLRARIVCLGLLLSALAGPAFAAAETKSAPDLSGIWTRKWKVAAMYDNVTDGPGPVMVDPAHPHIAPQQPDGTRDNTALPTPWVADYSNPILKPETRAIVKRITDEAIAGHPHAERQTLCFPSGVPEVLNLRDNMQMLQPMSGKEVTIVYWRDNQARHIYMNVGHSKNPTPSWYGESVGHYEGDTLVVDTIGLNDKTDTDRFGTPHSDEIHVVEHYRVSDDKKFLEVLFKVDDPKVFTTQWAGRADYRRDPEPVLETICAENNRPIGIGDDTAIPVAEKPDF